MRQHLLNHDSTWALRKRYRDSPVCASGPIGDHARALEYVQAALGLAKESELHPWTPMARYALSGLHLHLMTLSQGQDPLKRARALSKETGSLFWMRCGTGFLDSMYIQQNESMLVKSLLNTTVEPGTPLETRGQRLIGSARRELALASGEPVPGTKVHIRP